MRGPIPEGMTALERLRCAHPGAALLLASCNIRDVDLSYLKFFDASLTDIAFLNSNLSEARLESTTLRNVTFGHCNLSGATFPSGARQFENDLTRVEELTKTLHTTLFALLGLCAYIAMSVLSSKDGDLIAGATLVTLPVIQKTLTATAFYVVAPFVALALNTYLLLQLHSLLAQLDRLPAIFPDRLTIIDKLSPAIVTRSVATHIFSAALPHVTVERLPRLISIFTFAVIWLPVPLVAAIGVFRVAGIPSMLLTLTSVFIFVVATSFSLVSWHQFCYLSSDPPNGTLLSFVATRLIAFLLPASVWLLAGYLGYLRPLNCRHQDLVGADFRSLFLKGADFTDAKMQGADFSGANLQEARFQSANLTKATFARCDLRGATLMSATLTGASIVDTNLTDAIFVNANLDDATISSSRSLRGCSFATTSLRHARLTDSHLDDADFADANLSGATIQSTSLKGSDFLNAQFDASRLTAVDLEGAGLRAAHLTGAQLINVNLRFVALTGAIMDHSELDGACDLTFSKLSGVTATAAHFANVTLRQADLHGANLSNTTLAGANLHGANLQLANLSSADLSGGATNLIEANLRGANLTGTNLTGLQQVRDAIVDSLQWFDDLRLLKPPPFGLEALRQQWTPAQIERHGGPVYLLRPRRP